LNTFGIFQSHYQTSLLQSYPSSSIAWIGTIQGFLLNVVGIGTGRLYDNGHAKTLVYIGSALNVAGLLATSFSVTYVPIFFSLGLCVGLGNGVLFIPSMAIVATHFDERKRPLATGIAAAGAAVGGTLYPVLFRSLVGRIGLPWTVRSFASVNAGLLIVSCLLVRPLIVEPATSGASTPQSSTTGEMNKDAPRNNRRQILDPTAFRDIPFMLFSLAMFFLWLGIDVPFFFLPSFAQDRLHLSADWGDYLLSIMNASAIAGRLVLGLAAVYAGAFATWQFSIGASCIILVCWVAVHNLPGIIVLVVLYGGVTTGVSSLMSAALLVISPEISVVGTRLGMSGVLGAFGCLVGPPVAGAIQGTSAGYVGLTSFAAAVYLAAFGILWVARVFYKGSAQVKEVDLKDLESSLVALPKVSEDEERRET